MPKREQLLNELSGEKDYGVLLMVQMDGVPETIQLVVATTTYDESVGGLRDKSQYVIRAIGVREHQVSVGIFGGMKISDDHPLVYQYNQPPTGVFFKGTPKDPNALVLDIFQGYASTFGPWRQIPDYLNTSKPLFDLVKGGGDMLGQMPKPLAERMKTVLEHHELEAKLVEDTLKDPPLKALMLDESYVLAMDFTIETLNKK